VSAVVCEHGSLRRKCDLCDLEEAVREAAVIFVALGEDMGTFNGAFVLDGDERRMVEWLRTWAPDLLPQPSEAYASAHSDESSPPQDRAAGADVLQHGPGGDGQ
jgi:hypothetical protein